MSGSTVAPTQALTARQIAAYASSAGFTGDALVTAVAVALAESKGVPTEIPPPNRDGSRDRGLWQINTVHGGADRDLINPATNAAYAYRVSNGGKDFSPWVAWKSNAHVSYLPVAQAAVAELGATGGANAGIGALAGGPIDDLVGGVGDPIVDGITAAASEVIEAMLPIGLQIVFSVAALGLIALGLARLTDRSPSELFSTASTFTGAGGIAKAVI